MDRFHRDDVDHVEDQGRHVPEDGGQKDLRLRHVLQNLRQPGHVFIRLNLIDDLLDLVKYYCGPPTDRVRLSPAALLLDAEQRALHHTEELADQTYAAERWNA